MKGKDMRKSDQILEKAIDILTEHGWYQGGFNAYDGVFLGTEDDIRYKEWLGEHTAPVCAMGALRRAATGSSLTAVVDMVGGEAIQRLSRAMPRRLADDPVANIINNNDDPSTTREDILSAFKRALEGK